MSMIGKISAIPMIVILYLIPFIEEVGEESIRVELQREKVQNWLLEKNTLTLTEKSSTDDATTSEE